jgi:hypothetical protein
MKCLLCASPGKYKCPGCVARYCSVACYASHKVACVPVAAALKRPAVPALQRTVKKRPYEADREEISFTASQDLLQRVLETPEAAAVVAVLRHRRPAGNVPVQPDEKQLVEEGEQDNEEPEVVSSKRPKMDAGEARGAKPASVAEADCIAQVHQVASAVVRVCNASSLQAKRDIVLQLMEQPDGAVFCDKILRVLGARDEHGRCALEVTKAAK